LTNLRVLLVDDSDETVLVGSNLLRKMGHTPVVARSGAEPSSATSPSGRTSC
jgi:CheY-like chemotaxis protein